MTIPDNKQSESSSYQKLQAQIIDLQATVAYLEMTLESLDTVVSKQDKQLQDMQRQLQLMFVQLTGGELGETTSNTFDARLEIPPHY